MPYRKRLFAILKQRFAHPKSKSEMQTQLEGFLALSPRTLALKVASTFSTFELPLHLRYENRLQQYTEQLDRFALGRCALEVCRISNL